MSETTQPTPQPTPQPIPLSAGLVGELVRSLDMTAEFLRLASPRVRTELSAYLADFHPHLEREELIDLLGNRAVCQVPGFIETWNPRSTAC